MLAIRQYIEETPIVSQEFISFNIENIEEYKKLFNVYKERGIIDNKTQFEDTAWVVNNAVHNFSIKFNLNEVMYKQMQLTTRNTQTFEEFIVSLKVFVLYGLSEVGTKRMSVSVKVLASLIISEIVLKYPSKAIRKLY